MKKFKFLDRSFRGLDVLVNTGLSVLLNIVT